MTPCGHQFKVSLDVRNSLVCGMKDDIYSLSGPLSSNSSTTNGAVIVTDDSCQEAIVLAIRNWQKNHTVNQVDGIYVLRQNVSVPPSSHLCALQPYQIPLSSTEHLNGFSSGYTVPGTHWLADTPNIVDHTCLKTIISESVLLPEPPCQTLVIRSKHCHHPTRNNEYSDLSRASHARVYTSYEMESHAHQRLLFAITVLSLRNKFSM